MIACLIAGWSLSLFSYFRNVCIKLNECVNIYLRRHVMNDFVAITLNFTYKNIKKSKNVVSKCLLYFYQFLLFTLTLISLNQSICRVTFAVTLFFYFLFFNGIKLKREINLTFGLWYTHSKIILVHIWRFSRKTCVENLDKNLFIIYYCASFVVLFFAISSGFFHFEWANYKYRTNQVRRR